jgi:phytoene dehydrogenase-like protein
MENRIHRATTTWLKTVEAALARYEQVPGRSVKLLLSDQDMWRLLNWKSWSLRYAVSADFILATLLNYFRNVRRRRPGSISLGVSVPSLTGHRVREIIEAAMETAFSNGENFDARRAEMQDRILGQRLQKFPTGLTLEESIQQYRQRIQKQKLRNETFPKRYIRAWRGNPFK